MLSHKLSSVDLLWSEVNLNNILIYCDRETTRDYDVIDFGYRYFVGFLFVCLFVFCLWLNGCIRVK